jgi:alpha-mannosidase
MRWLSICLAGGWIAGVGGGSAVAAVAAPKADITRDRVLYAVGYAHLDTQWRWDYPETIREYIPNTLRDNFALFEKYPGYVFNFTGSRRYEFMQEYYPEEYETMKRYIASGRWFPAGSSVDEGDSIVPSGESIIRQVLYGNRYFRREFGMASVEYMLPDCFGFPSSLPTLLVHCGLKGFSTQKLTWGSAVGIPFKVGRWIGPDGSEIVAALDPGPYDSKVREDLSQSSSWLKRIENTGKQSGAYVDYHYFGVGDRGGAPDEESVKWIEKAVQGSGPVKVLSARAEDLFNDLTPPQIAKLPAYAGEFLLTNHSAGAITSQAYMKRWNRQAELLADAAERSAVAAFWLGSAYPVREIDRGWNLVLGTQMHDILPGTSIPKAYEYSWNDHVLALNHFAAVETEAIRRVASVMDTRAEGKAVVVYNPLAVEREDIAEAALAFSEEAPAEVRVHDPEGREVPAQVIGREGRTLRVLFLARVPPVGYAVYEVRAASSSAGSSELKVSADSLENNFYRVKINEQGDVASIFDKKAGKELLAAPARLEFQYENPKRSPAWDMDWEDRQKPPFARVEGPAKVRVIESGPARVAVEIDRTSQGSRFVQRVRLAGGAAGDRVEWDNLIDWQTRESSLKAAFPLAASNPKAAYEEKVGILERANNDPKKFEVHQQQWFDVTDRSGKYGAAVLNDSKYGGDKPSDNLIRLTLLYTPGVRGGYRDQATQDFGRHQMRYAVAGHAGDWRTGDVVWKARRLNQPLAVFEAKSHPGALGRKFSLLKTDNAQVEISAVKKAEDGDEIIVRLQEWHGRPATVRLSAAVPIVAAREVNGQEQPVADAALQQGVLPVQLKAYGIRAFALKLAPAGMERPVRQAQPVVLSFDADVVSTNANRSDGAVSKEGGAYPAEQFPAKLASGGVEFVLGPGADGKKNAVVCRGQTVVLPSGNFNRVYFLASAAEEKAAGAFQAGDRTATIGIGKWNGYIGQWDNRSMEGDTMIGLAPGYVQKDEVAWFATHWHSRKADEAYEFCYVFKYGLDLPPGATKIVLPKNEKIRIFAMTAVQDPAAPVVAACPLYDTLEENRKNTEPGIVWDAGKANNAQQVSIVPPLYWQRGQLRYTTDGTEPTSTSPAYREPFWISGPATVKARVFGDCPSPVAAAAVAVQDSTAPTVRSISLLGGARSVSIVFSEPLRKKDAEQTGRYRFQPALPVESVKANAEGTEIELTLGTAPEAGTAYQLTLQELRDASPTGNILVNQPAPVTAEGPVYRLESFVADGKNFLQEEKPGLPVKGRDPWTMNLAVRMDRQPAHHTLIAGFGECVDRSGTGRFMGKFRPGIHYWTSTQDVSSQTPFELNQWQMITAVYGGEWLVLYRNGREIGRGKALLADDKPLVNIAPLDPWDREQRFKGEIRDFAIWKTALTPKQIEGLYQQSRLR